MNFRQVEALRALVQAGTVTAAAELLHISQPAVSRLLRDLEYRAGFVVFDRVRGRLQLTPEGRALYREVERAFVGLEQVEAAARDIASHSTGVLRIVSMPILSGGLLPPILAEMAALHPDLSLSLDTARAGTVAEQVAMGGYDVGFATDPVHDAAAVTIHTLGDRGLSCVFRPDHALAGRERIRLEDLADEPLVAFSRGTHMRSRLDKAFAIRGLQMNTRVSATTVESICRFVEVGCGCGITYPFTCHVARALGLTVVPLDSDLAVEVVAVTQAHARPSRLVTELIERMTEGLAGAS